MLTLILMRHAKSDWSHTGLPDHERPLNARGRRNAAALGVWLNASNYTPDEVLSSTAQRTRETFGGLDCRVKPRFERSLYHAPADVMLNLLHTASGTCVLMIGHNPGISIFSEQIVRAAPNHPKFEATPTGATLITQFNATTWRDVTWGTASVLDFIVPRDVTTRM